MAGIYIHIPYCRQKCNYCNFFSVVSTRNIPTMVNAICREIDLKSRTNTEPIETVYLGGGTPSLIDHQLLKDLLTRTLESYNVSADAEITLEANPDDITPESLQFWRKMGINRLSIGIQSFRQEDLNYLNRIHSAETAIKCVKTARQYGFPDLTIDLIYGIPTLKDTHWIQNLRAFADLEIPHLSAYALTVEPKTPLYQLIEKGKVKPVDEYQSSAQFEILMDFMRTNGYLHYEISNFCLPDHFARHNLSYWKGIPYFGFGPSAHSFDGSRRSWNVASIGEYLKMISEDRLPEDSEILRTTDKYNEYVMTGLRTMWGCQLSQIEQRFGTSYADYFLSRSEKWISAGLMITSATLASNGQESTSSQIALPDKTSTTNSQFILTDKGKLQADGIAADLFVVE